MKKVIQIIIGNVLMAFTVSALILDHSIVAAGSGSFHVVRSAAGRFFKTPAAV